jgi:hypothetical protein
MHQVIRLLVYSDTEENALSEAEGLLDNMCVDGKPFDYYTLFNDDKAVMSGKARWGDLPAVTQVQCDKFNTEKCDTCSARFNCYTKDTMILINEGMETTRRDFHETFEKVKEMINSQTEEELNEETGKDGWRFKFLCGELNNNQVGSNCYLYDQDGEAISNKRHLNDVLTKWKCIYEEGKPPKTNPYKDLNIFCVPCDVHY